MSGSEPMFLRRETGRQLLRYAVTGLAANGALYAAYLLLIARGLGHKTAMTITYFTSVLCTFILNRRWTFTHEGAMRAALIRYVATYAIGYALNLIALAVAVDVLGLPPQWAMAALIVISAALIFLAQKYWVFPAGRVPATG